MNQWVNPYILCLNPEVSDDWKTAAVYGAYAQGLGEKHFTTAILLFRRVFISKVPIHSYPTYFLFLKFQGLCFAAMPELSFLFFSWK